MLRNSNGFLKVRTIGKAGDFDCALIMQNSKEKIAVQAKRYRSKTGVKAVQETASARKFYGCTKAIVATNSYFTVPAKKLAKANNIELWDRSNLIESLTLSRKPEQSNGIVQPHGIVQRCLFRY